MDVRVLLAERGADAERLDLVTGYLRQEISQLDVSVTALPSGPPPEGSRALDAATVGGLLVTAAQSTTALQSIITTIRGWLGRGTQVQRMVRVEIDGDVLEIADASAEDQDKLIDLFVSRHS
ncbi:hypothetical protein Lesp02_04490 [Lentzea sp. NBRC 105346]|uniref:hypothetical protein n=1 Tax=Lentzea sp. NBRC 105346 TaxID=3032205 RepID=UPI0024A45F8A|nr:hypothetical protein [Lentzea sp. NBRC 105346]GLZ28259.1 hypothetical protein Lesp02_04490 [Lentzea sp. NBRC 105346]